VLIGFESDLIDAVGQFFAARCARTNATAASARCAAALQSAMERAYSAIVSHRSARGVMDIAQQGKADRLPLPGALVAVGRGDDAGHGRECSAR
jgi:hypothetical protein